MYASLRRLSVTIAAAGALATAAAFAVARPARRQHGHELPIPDLEQPR